MTRGVDERGQVVVVVASVGVRVPPRLLLGPQTVASDVVVELIHAKSAARGRVGSTCNGHLIISNKGQSLHQFV